ncbi:MAG: hypothetical protein ABL886_17100 [Rhodoglobus sp.]
MPKRKVTVSMDEDVTSLSTDAAWAERISLSAYVERAVKEYLANHPPVIPGTPPQP